jgi:hypothetical protein
MHRSGTSYLASVLAAIGVGMGEHLLAADAGNPRGYFEDVSVLAFHKKLLARRAGVSQTLADFLPGADFDPAWSADESAEADALLAKLAREGFWGWKEPRSCLFLAQWLDRMPATRCVAVFRHPLEVFYSFLKRGDWSALFAPESIFEACAVYNEAILAAREKSPGRFLVLDAGVAFADGPSLAASVAAFLGMELAQDLKLPEFAAAEFSSLGVLQEQHELMAVAYPGAASTYERMQEAALKAADFSSDTARAPLPPALMEQIVAAIEAEKEANDMESNRASAGQSMVNAFCMNVPAGHLRELRDRIAADVERKHAKVSVERDEYIANFDKYKALYDEFFPLYENYFKAWRETERTLKETREWIDRDLMPKIERWRAQMKALGIPFEE